ncbi:hypothetical protein D3C86_1875340 [compost metagenome]
MSCTTFCASSLTSIFCPPNLNSGDRSTTVTSKPNRDNQNARVGPAILAPDTRTFLFSMYVLIKNEAMPMLNTHYNTFSFQIRVAFIK